MEKKEKKINKPRSQELKESGSSYSPKFLSDRALLGQFASLVKDLKNMSGETLHSAAEYGLKCIAEAELRGSFEKEQLANAKAEFQKALGEKKEEKPKAEKSEGKKAKSKSGKKAGK